MTSPAVPSAPRARVVIRVSQTEAVAGDPDRSLASERGLSLQEAGSSDDALMNRAETLLETLRAESILIDAWRQDVIRVSLRPPWPLSLHLSVAPDRGRVVLRCIVEDVQDSRDPSSTVSVQFSNPAPIAATRAEHVWEIVRLLRISILHELDEHLQVDDRLANDPHDSAVPSRPDLTRDPASTVPLLAGWTSEAGEVSAPDAACALTDAPPGGEPTRAESMVLGDWRRDARRVSLQPSWPIPLHFLVEEDRGGRVVLQCIVKVPGGAHVVRLSEVAPIVADETERLRSIVRLGRIAILHELDEHLQVKQRTPGWGAPSGRSARITVELLDEDEGVLYEGTVVQAEGESDGHLVACARTLLESLRSRSGSSPPTQGDPPPAQPREPRTGAATPCHRLLRSDQLDELGVLATRDDQPNELVDAVLAGLAVAYDLRGDAVVPDPRGVLRRHATGPGSALGALADAVDRRPWKLQDALGISPTPGKPGDA